MAHFTIKGNKHANVEFTRSNSTWTVLANATLSVTNNSAIFEDSDKSGNTLINNGHVFADNGEHTVTIDLEGEGTHVTNSATGVITGLIGVDLLGDDQRMVNRGRIDVSEEGIKVRGTQSEVTNHGTILARGSAIDLIDCDNSTIDNAADGKIRSTGGTGVSFSTDTDVKVTFTNEGLVTSKFDAVSGSNGDDKVVNHGTLNGNVSLGDGNNVFDTRGGIFNGTFTAGDGDDVLITDKANIGFSNTSDTDGTDTVKSTVSYKLGANVEILRLLGHADLKGTGTAGAVDQQIFGNSGDNVIKGLANGNFLTGGKGNDTLSGASFSQDIFFFATGDGKDTITNFVEGQFADLLDVSKWHSITDFDDLMAHHVKNVAGGVMIFAGDDSVTLDGLHKANLVEDNFVF